MKLVIIEGAGKKETIEKYLGKGYKVFATKGHVRDLPAKSLAVDVRKNFEPKYTIMDDKKGIVEELIKKAESAEEVYLATDPDREGEAISWHLAHILNIPADKKVRIEFNEISKSAVEQALLHPREINLSLVDAQQARRVLDRLVGYKVSPVLCKKIQSKLSAGRVQSVALELVVIREREILNFKPEEYWYLTATLEKLTKGIAFKALLSLHNGKKIKVVSKEQMDEVLANLEGAGYAVSDIKSTQTKGRPPAPFITSTLQQEASSKLGMSLKTTSSVAQMLYEGVDLGTEGKVALVTYIRTDSTRVAPDAQAKARDYLRERFGDKYVPAKPNVYASKKSAQDAHEAIRPISVTRTPESIRTLVKKDVYRLYKLIYERFLASQMTEALYNSVTVDVEATTNLHTYTFRAKGKTMVFDGFTAIYNTERAVEEDENTDEKENSRIPELEVQERLNCTELKPEQKFTKPPTRYTEATLVKAMEEKGIGRPATYTPTITTISSRNYTEREGKYIKPTELGFQVTDMLIKYFPDIMDIGFTADMETKLDNIEEGDMVWQNLVGEYYQGLEDKIKCALGDDYTLKEPDVQTDIACSKCGANMVVKSGRNGKFLACPAYPKCKNTMSYSEEGGAVEKIVPEVSDVICDKCGANMVVKMGRYGKFLACPAYPKCKNIVSIKDEADTVDYGTCPVCQKPLRKKMSKRNTIFYGCSSYPDCTFLSSYPLHSQKCPLCNSFMTVREAKGARSYRCGNQDCGHAIKDEQSK